MANTRHSKLSRRERQIMDIIYRKQRATAAEIRAGLPDPPSYSAVRAMLRLLEQKGHLRHTQEGPRYVFFPVVARSKAGRSALKHLVETFFEDSVEDVVATLLDVSRKELTDDELDRINNMIDQARKEGR